MDMQQDNQLQLQGLKQTLIEAADLAGRLDVRSDQATRRVEAAAVTLEQSARHLSEGGERFAGDALRVIGTQVQQAIGQATAQTAGEFQREMRLCVQAAQQATQALSAQSAQLTAAQKTLVWKGLVALAAGAVLTVVGCGFYVRHSLKEVEDAQFAKDILRATQTGVLTPCGDGALCIKMGAKPKRAGRDGEYVVLVE